MRNTCPNCGGNLTFDENTDKYSCDTCTFPVCPNCGETLNDEDDSAFLAETGKCSYCDEYFSKER